MVGAYKSICRDNRSEAVGRRVRVDASHDVEDRRGVPVWTSTSESGYRHRVDGVGRLNFDFHTAVRSSTSVPRRAYLSASLNATTDTYFIGAVLEFSPPAHSFDASCLRRLFIRSKVLGSAQT